MNNELYRSTYNDDFEEDWMIFFKRQNFNGLKLDFFFALWG